MENIGLVLEGGGMRAAYTSGVLEAFMDNNIDFNYVIGVSAGASCGISYVAGQRARNKNVFVDRAGDKENTSIVNFLLGRGYLNMDYIYHEIPNRLNPFDFDSFINSKKEFKALITNCKTGQVEYIGMDSFKKEGKDFLNNVLQASSSLPIISKPVRLKGQDYYDGGVVDSIPLKKSFQDGNKRNVVVLTRNTDYRKSRQKLGPLRFKLARKYPNILKALDRRHHMYNDSVEEIINLEKKGDIFVFRPIKAFSVKRLEKDREKLESLYIQGYEETIERLDEFNSWLKKIN